MLWRSIGLVLALAGFVLAAVPEQRIWTEVGQPGVVDAGHRVTGWRFKDPTEAYAASLVAWKYKPVQDGNYLLFCQGHCPAAELALPGHVDGPLPVLRTYLPQKGLIPGSARYILDERTLTAASPMIPVSAVAFQFGTEAVVGQYKAGKGVETLAVFDYPTPQIARVQVHEFQKLPDAMVKRSGPLIGIVLPAADKPEASRLLAETEYAASISWDEPPPLVIPPKTAVQIVLAGIELAGIILLFCLGSGLAYAGIRILMRRFGNEDADEPMIVLGLDHK
jgi:hypothetical protein